MIQAYSKRLLFPFLGQVQIVESDQLRALTLDGYNWEVQFKVTFDDTGSPNPYQQENARKHSYIRVAVIRPSRIDRNPVPPHLDYQMINVQLEKLAGFLEDITVPLPSADLYEYWLLDGVDEQPLALIFSCVTADEMSSFPERLEWKATPSAVMKVATLPEEEKIYTPPVNSRFEQLINERAGKHPKARWIKRREGLVETFPPLMVREDWDSEEGQQLCQRYIERQAPRLLMLHGLEPEDRLRLEEYARQNALEVDSFFGLYPEVADEKLMSAIRVEARLRLSAGEER
jgi:hypothetical protein